jgi:hypothetical protein
VQTLEEEDERIGKNRSRRARSRLWRALFQVRGRLQNNGRATKTFTTEALSIRHPMVANMTANSVPTTVVATGTRAGKRYRTGKSAQQNDEMSLAFEHELGLASATIAQKHLIPSYLETPPSAAAGQKPRMTPADGTHPGR